jgi:hypothetical protein
MVGFTSSEPHSDGPWRWDARWDDLVTLVGRSPYDFIRVQQNGASITLTRQDILLDASSSTCGIVIRRAVPRGEALPVSASTAAIHRGGPRSGALRVTAVGSQRWARDVAQRAGVGDEADAPQGNGSLFGMAGCTRDLEEGVRHN